MKNPTTKTPNPRGPKEALMLVTCPVCTTTPVQVEAWTFKTTSVTVPVCQHCQAETGITSFGVKTSALIDMKVPSPLLSHKAGLVTFGGAR